jgi:sulfate adenylyltransferase subunit 2
MTTVTEVSHDADHPFALTHLDALESEAVHIFREVAGSSNARSSCSRAARTPWSCCTWR